MADASRKGVYAVSKDVVAREIEGELIIVPLTSGIGDLEGSLYTLNDVGRDIWSRFDGRRSLEQIIEALQSEYDAPKPRIETDVIGLTQELLTRGIITDQDSAA